MTAVNILYDSVVAAALMLAAFALGTYTLRLSGLHAGQHWLAAVCGLGMLSVGIMLLGMAGLFYRVVWVPLIVVLAAIGIAVLFRSYRQAGAAIGERVRRFVGRHRLFSVWAVLLLLLSASTVVWIALTYAAMPPYEWDEISYHMALPAMYVQAHRLIYVPTIVHSNWPMNSGMLYTVGLLFGSDGAAHFINLGITLLMALGVVRVARRFLDVRVGIVAAALVLSVPLVQRLAGTGLIDIVPGLYALAALYALHGWQAERRWPWLVVSGACCGFAAGSKLMGGGFALLIGLLLLLDELRQRPLHVGALLRHGALFGLAGLLTVGPWYARSYLWTGNPIWPFAYGVFGGRNWDALGDEYHMQSLMSFWTIPLERTPAGLVQSMYYLLLRPEDLELFDVGFGLVLPLGTLAALLLAWRAPPLIWQSLVVSIGFYMLWFLLVSLQLRFLLPITPLMALATAYVLVWCYDYARFDVLRAALVVGVMWLLVGTWPWADRDARTLFEERMAYVRGDVSREQWIDQHVDIAPLLRYANRTLPDDARVLLVPYETRGYYLEHDYVWGNPVSQRIIPFERFASAAELAAFLREMGITHVIDSPIYTYDDLRYAQQTEALLRELQAHCGTPLHRHQAAVLYTLTECSTHHTRCPDGPGARALGLGR
jgi:hypothetical protein